MKSVQSALGLVALAALGCATAPVVDSPLAKGPTGGRALVVVLDASLDGESVRAAAQASFEAALALTSGEAGVRLAVGVIEAHDGEASVVASLEDQDDRAREALARKVAGVARGGRPSAARGVRRAIDMLSASGAERGSLVLLLASGSDARELAPLESELALRGMKVHAVALGGGPRDAVADVAAQALGYAVARAVPPVISGGALGGGRLAWIATGGTLPEAGAGARALQGTATDARVWDRLPEKLALAATGDDARALLVYRPTWELGFDSGAPAPIVYLGEPVPIGLLVRGQSLPAATAFEVSLEVPGHGSQPLKGSVAPRGLRYDGVLPPPEGEGPQEARLTLEFRLGAASFSQPVQAHSVARVRTGPQPPRVRVSPGAIDLGVAWVGTRLAARLLVQGDPQRPTHVELDAAPGVTALAALDLAPGEEKALELSFDPGRLAPGTRLKVRAEVAGPEGGNVRPRARGEYARRENRPLAGVPSWTGVVPVAFEAHEATLPDSFALGALVPGGEVSARFPLRVTPASPVEVSARLVGSPPGVSLEAKLVGEKLTLIAKAGEGALAGPRVGFLEVRLAGSHAASLTRKVSLEVTPRPVLALECEPANLALQGRYGWAEARIKLAVNERASLALAPGALEGASARITPRRDLRIQAADGRDARTLEPGQARELVLRVYLGSDLPPGRYTGALSVRLEGSPGLEPLVRQVPVALEVTR